MLINQKQKREMGKGITLTLFIGLMLKFAFEYKYVRTCPPDFTYFFFLILAFYLILFLCYWVDKWIK